MARIKKKGTSGTAKNYITRTQAVRKLQISLPDFRRLCIFKGIYPREPRNKKKASKTATPAATFYYTKDIQYLHHEPLLQKFRDHKALAKKIGRALGRGEVEDASRLERIHKPRIALDHIIKERYPTFTDALRDLDDCLSMIFLFANLPSTSTIPPKTIALCQRLCLEFEHYIIATKSLRKSFLSIKGIYYQARIQGENILWLVPYKFVQQTSGDIDFRIMGTFVEFYTTLLGFVNFRLYSSIGLIYPPKFNSASDDKGGELGAFTLQGYTIGPMENESSEPPTVDPNSEESIAATARAQSIADKLIPTHNESNSDLDATAEVIDENDQAMIEAKTAEPVATNLVVSKSSDVDNVPGPAPGKEEAERLFKPFVFYLSRETPRQPLEFLLKAFGCTRVGWDPVLGDGAFTTNESNPAITHQVVDRPPVVPIPRESEGDATDDGGSQARLSRGRVPGRIYVQPQWVWDCVNACELIRPDYYAPGATLPPHLSPWVKPRQGISEADEPVNGDVDGAEIEDGEDFDELEDDEDDRAKIEQTDRKNDKNGEEGWDGFSSESDEASSDEEIDEEHGQDEARRAPVKNNANNSPPAENVEEDDLDEDQIEAHQTQRELEAEFAGLPRPSRDLLDPRRRAERRAKREQKTRQDHLERQLIMMPRRKRKLYEQMQYGIRKKEDAEQKIASKRRRLEREGRGAVYPS